MTETVTVAEVLRAWIPTDGMLEVDDTYVSGALAVLDLHESGERTGQILLKVLEEVADEPLSVRVGRWSVRMPAETFVSAVCSAVTMAAMEAAGVTDLPFVVLSALVPFLFRVEDVRLDSARQAPAAVLAPDIAVSEPGDWSTAWAELPEDLRHEVPYTVYAQLVAALSRADASRIPLGAQGFPEPVRPAWRPRVLTLCDEWFPARGGISALNRSLSIGLVEAGADVYCHVPAASDAERADAAAAGVRLIAARPLPGAAPDVLLGRRPTLPDGVVPDIVVGHTRVSGPQAKAMVEDHFEGAFRFHFVHMLPDEVAWWKELAEENAAERADRHTRTELALARDADCVAAVGPRLHRWMQRELSVLDEVPPLMTFTPGFDGGDTRRAAEPPPGVPQILLFGRLDDYRVKGLDIAARSLGEAAALLGGGEPGEPPFELLLRGVPTDQASKIRADVLEWSGLPSLQVTLREFSTDDQDLRHDLRRASLVLMPSRAEGFGLAGTEAIRAGVPVLISDKSGLGMLLATELDAEQAKRAVLPIRNDPHDVRLWGSAIAAVLRNRKAAFDDAAALRERMAVAQTWARCCADLLNQVGRDERG